MLPPIVIFLDVDGVLNSEAWYRARLAEGVAGTTDRQPWPRSEIDPACVRRLERLRRQAHARYVVSSSWRAATVDRTRFRFGLFGIPASAIYSQTPRLYQPTVPREGYETSIKQRGEGIPPAEAVDPVAVGRRLATTRGREIAAWWQARAGRSRFVVLDDEPDVEPYLDRLVHTDAAVGLTDADCARALALLAAP